MVISSPFRTAWLTWFKCPHCTHVSYSAYVRGEVQEHPPRLLIRYRCKRCGQDSKLLHPHLGALLGFATGIVLFVVIFGLAVAQDGWSLSVLLGLLLGMALIGVFCWVVSRVSKYVPISRDEP